MNRLVTMKTVFVCSLLATLCLGADDISYVIEPFESVGENWFNRINDTADVENRLNLTTTRGLFGTSALQVEYRVQHTDTGSSVDFGHVVKGHRRHNCHGATHLSLWYKVIEPQSVVGHTHLRLVLMDGSSCEDCSDLQQLEHYYSFHNVLNDRTDWQELRIQLRGDSSGDSNPTSQLWGAGWLGQVGYDKLDVHLLKGWRVELSIGPDAKSNSTSEGVLLVDQLACVGGGDMFGAAFHSAETFEASLVSESWKESYYQSSLSKNLSSTTLDNGLLTLNYTVQQTETWGGYIDFRQLAPGEAYYNLSQASAVSLDYQVLKAASPKGRVHLRVNLLDERDCLVECDAYTVQGLEKYFSFHHILDDSNLGAMNGNITVLLSGDKESTSPFWLTGWEGSIDNGVLDKSRIKGFFLELSVDSQGEIGSLVSGSVALSNMATLPDVARENTLSTGTTRQCIVEPGVSIERGDSFRRVEFQGGKCCEICDVDPDCLYAVSSGVDCYMAAYLEPDSISLQDTGHKQSLFTTYWKDDASVRGDYCSLCECRQADRTINCRGRDLKITPKTFSPVSRNDLNSSWTPRVLDLSGNPQLVLLGSGALYEISDTLEELKLPLNMRHVSLRSVSDLPLLRIVEFEGVGVGYPVDSLSVGTTMQHPPSAFQHQEQKHHIDNVITEDSEFFEDVCCSHGSQIELLRPPGGLTFCDMQVDTPGADAVYEEFYEYFDAETVEIIDANSPFMSEAAESPQKCAEYCAIHDQCMYFSYDSRTTEAEPRCNLLANNGTRVKVCCGPEDYADANQTKPGWTSGRVPRTRRLVDNAKLIFSSKSLVLEKANKFSSQYVLYLGSTPLRGAVWVEPTVASTTNLEVLFSPSRIVLYDNATSITINITVLNIDVLESPETLLITNTIEACDAAFREKSGTVSENTLQINVVAPKSVRVLLISILPPVALVIATVAVAFAYIGYKRRQADALWTLKKSDLCFDDPPTVVGRGTFGLVVLAEYRGTKVVVKRLTVSKERKTGKTFKNCDLDQSAANYASGSGHSSIHDSMTSDEFGRRFESTDFDSLDRFNCHPVDIERGLDSQKPSHRSLVSATSCDQVSTGSMSGIMSRRTIRSLIGCGEPVGLKADSVEEMRQLSKLRHPCITTVMGAILEKKQAPMLVMEYMDHGSLRDLLNNETMLLDGEYLLPILRDIAQGLRFLHTETPQVIHGNLKAQNILVDSRFRAKVAGFGLSQKKRFGATGSPFWMAPEVIRRETSNTAASDIYSFGITLYEVYSRKYPYDGEDPSEVMKLVADPLVSRRPPVPASCPPEIQSVMNDCQRSQPEKRPTFEELDMRFKRLDVATVEPWETHPSIQTRKAKRTDKLLHDVFPHHVAQALRDGRKVEPESHEMVTIFFSDIVGFTDISATMSPMKISEMLDRLYSKFDDLSHLHDVFKVETIGDAYMCVTNLIKKQPDHAKRIADFSVDAVRAANETMIDRDDPERGYLSIRVGFHSGPVVANVVGSRNPRYCLFGDSVNTASRMESNSVKNRIHCSESAAKLLRLQHPHMTIYSRGWINVKGKGAMKTYWCNEAGDSKTIHSTEDIQERGTSRNCHRRRSTGSLNSSSTINTGSCSSGPGTVAHGETARGGFSRFPKLDKLYDGTLYK